jgi:hypothetical protein
MPLYELTLKDGSTIQVEGPQGASAADLVNIYNRQTDTSGLAQERAIQEEIAARRAKLRATAPTREAGVLDYLGEIPKGLAAGAAGLVESAALGAITPLDEEAELAAREAIQSAGRGVREYLEPDIGLEEAVPRKFSEALGSFGAIGLASLIPGVGVPLAGGLAVGAGAGEASERARAAGATEEERAQAARLGALVGAGELLPIKFIKALGRPTTGDIVDRLKRIGASAGVEGAQEAAAEIAQNLIEQGIYNPEQGTFTNTGEALGYGAGVGGFVQALVDIALPGRSRGVSGDDELLGLPAPEERLGLPAPQARLPAPSTVVTPEGEAMTQGQADQLRREQERVRAEEALILGDMPSEEVRGAQERGRREAEDEQFLRELEEAQRTDYAEAQERAREREALRAAERGDEEAFAQPDLFAMEQEQARRTLGEPAPVQEEAPAPQAPMQETQMDIVDLIAQEQQRAESEQETAAGADITAVQQEQSQRRESALQEIIAADPRRTPDIRGTFQAVLESGGLSPQLTETEERMVRRAEDLRAAEDTVPRQLPSTPEDTQLAELEAAIPQRQLRGEQLTLEGVPSRRQEKRAQRLGATEPVRVEEPAEAPRPVTTEQLDAMGIPKAAPVRRRIQGRNLSAVPDQEFVRNQLTEFANAKATRPETKFKITKFLEGAPDEQLEMFGPRGGMPKTPKATRTEPTERRRDAEPQRLKPAPSGVGVQTGGRDTEVGRTPEEVRDTERAEPPRPDRLERAERDVADVADREGALPSALEEIATPKAVVPKRKRRSPVEVLDTARGKKPAEEAKAEPEAQEKPKEPKTTSTEALVSGPSTTARKDVTTKNTTEAAPVAKKKAAPKTKDNAEATTELESAQEEVISTPFRAEFFSPETQYNVKDTSLGTDKLIVMDLLRRVADPVKSGKSKQIPENAARLYFGKKKRLVDALELMAYDMAFGVSTKQGGFQREGETDVEVEFMSGMGNANVAKAAANWVYKNLSPETIKTFQKQQSKYAEFALKSLDQEIQADALAADVKKEMEARAKEQERTRKAEVLDEEQTTTVKLKPQSIEDIDVTDNDIAAMNFAEELYGMRGEFKSGEFADFSIDLTKDAVAAAGVASHPEVMASLREGNLPRALKFIEMTTPNKRVAQVARKLADVVGTTKVVISDTLDVAGKFDPQTNTITLNAETADTPHVVLHELTHAATSATLANKSHPMTKKLTKLYNDVKDKLGTAYGAQSLDEFVAESFSNVEFQQTLAGIKPDGSEFSAWETFSNAVMNFMRKLLGMQTKPMGSALDATDSLIDGILHPAPEQRNAGELFLMSTREGVTKVLDNLGAIKKSFPKVTPKFIQKFSDQTREFLRSGVKDNAKKIAMQLLPSQALADVANYYGIKGAMDLHKLMEQQRGAMAKSDAEVEGTLKFVDNWAKKNKDKIDALNKVVYTSTIYQVDPSKSRKQYESDPEKLQAWNDMRDDWRKLGKEGREVYENMRDTYKTQYERLKDVIFGKIDDTVTDEAARKKLKNEVYARLFETGTIEPYFPLTRSGNYKLSYALKPDRAAREQDAYVVEMFETYDERERAYQDLLNDSDVINESIERDTADSKPSYNNAPSSSFVGQTLQILRINNVSDDAQAEIMRLFIEALPESSFAKSLQRRKGTAGYKEDAIFALKSKAFDLSRQIERLRYSAKIRQLQNEIEEQQVPEDLKYLKNDILARAEFARNPPRDQIAQTVNRAAFLQTIGFSASSALVNMSQVPLFVYPFLGGRYGFDTAGAAIIKAGRILTNAGFDRKIDLVAPTKSGEKTVKGRAMPSIDNYFTRDENGDYVVRDDLNLNRKQLAEIEQLRPLVEMAAQRGQLNRSLFADTLGLDYSGRDRSVFDTVNSWAAFMFHQAEQFNRQVTLVSAYQLELDRLNNKPSAEERRLSTAEKQQKAAETALYDAQQTNGGTVLETAPRLAQQGIGRVAMMYKSYGIQMYYTMAKTARKAIWESGLSKEEKIIAWRQLSGVYGSAIFFAGISGMPLFGTVAMLFNLFTDDDEDDFETNVRKHIGEGWYKGGVTTLTGVDISGRVALTNLLFQANRFNTDPTPEERLVQFFGGPAASVGVQFYRGAEEFASGENMGRALENMVPSAIRNVLKATRVGIEGGYTTRRGDIISDDVTANDVFWQALGFPPVEYTFQQEVNQRDKRVEKAVTTTRSKLLKKYYLASRMGDYEGMTEALSEISKFNGKHPTAAIDNKTIDRSMKQHQETSLTMYNGITISPLMRFAIEQSRMEYSGPESLF